jgi:hypothetical protein
VWDVDAWRDNHYNKCIYIYIYIYILTTNLQDNWEATSGALKRAVLSRLRLLSRSEGLLYGRSAAASLAGSGEVTVRAPVGPA